MPNIIVNQSVGAGASVNLVAGNQYEFLPFNALVEVAIQTSATGVLATIFSGSDVLMQEGPVQIGTANVLPKYPDDFYMQDVAMQGDRLSVNVRNTTGGALQVVLVVRITPL